MKLLTQILQQTTLMKPNEQRAAIVSFLMAFLLMAAYFVLRPVRDAMASDWSDTEVSLLWNIQFFLSIGLVALYSLAITRLPFRAVVPMVYGAFAASFLLFYLGAPMLSDPTLPEKAFYLWVAAFSLFNLSVFWSLMADTFNQEQGKRLFAIIGAGASAGAMVGPSIPTLFAAHLGLETLMLIASIVLFSVIPLVLYLHRLKHTDLGNATLQADLSNGRLNGKWWTGFRDVIQHPYLLGIAVFILLYVFVSSFVYFEQKNLLAAYSRTERAQILGGIDWLVNGLTFVFAFFLTARIVQRFGMAFTLTSIPVLVCLGLVVLAFAPAVLVLLALQTVRRVGNYAVTRPARELLFTEVSTEQRFKAKPVIDVVVYRGGDAVSGSLFALLTEGLGIGLAAVSLIGSGIAALWAGIGLYLGRRYGKSSNTVTNTPDPNSLSYRQLPQS